MMCAILAGGSGTRLWPLSRELYPKQFLALNGNTSLLRQTVERAWEHFSDILVLTHNEQFFYVRDELRGFVSEDMIIREPHRRNTAPAVALAALYIKENYGNESFVVMPSDHVLSTEFFSIVKEAEKLCPGYLVTFGIKPSFPATGYGYIKPGEKLEAGYKVERFIEKPGREKAEEFVKLGYLWNSGIFLFSPELLIEEFHSHAPEIAEHMGSFSTLLENYASLPAISIDYAIMEKSSRAAVVPYSGEWRDIGNWESVYAIMKDALLVASREMSERVGEIAKLLKQQGRSEAVVHKTVHRPWGYYTLLEEGERYKVKRLCIYPGKSISLQRHHHRAEHWVVVKGTARVVKGEEEHYVHENESIYIPKSVVHRLENPGKVDLHLIEIQTGEYIEEDDIIRLEDEYGRC